ncbi:tetratricopeptide repeat protein [Halobacillus sp. BBL2006]|uniref:InlB B-repeat-containing protein n=1 Tax=Halobacillus sp. BBL2006 TaxID=1543706 RepID=UPI0005426141|nr:tetratricopeptide repeat protein [Halobacillus sp. BBL2006]KHE67984.1 hypothetical protein LD39_15525 [Halobacillus sp. BBL2006]
MKKKYLWLSMIALLIIVIGTTLTFRVVGANTLDEKLELANQAYQSEEWEKSIELYQKVLKIDPDHVEARLGLGKAYQAMNHRDEAIETINEGIDRKVQEHRYYLLLSDIYSSMGDVSKAVDVLDRGQKYSTHQSLKQAYKELISNIYIHTDREIVQEGYDREIELVYENEKGDLKPLEGEWSVQDTSIGTIESNDGSVRFEAAKTGKTAIEVKWESLTQYVTIEVAEQVVEEMTIEPSEVESLAVGESQDISVTGVDAAGEEMTFTPEWTSKEGRLEIEAQQDGTATIKAKEEGKDTLFISYQDYEKELDVVVDGESKSIDAQVEGEGSVTVFPDKELYFKGEKVTLEAFPEEGWEFTGWKGDLNGNDNPVNTTVDNNMDIVAVFEPIQHDLDLSISGEGEIIRDSLADSYDHMDQVSLRARAASGWEFAGWKGSYTGDDTRINLVMDEDKSLQAVFTREETEQEEEEPEETGDSREEEDSYEPSPPEPTSYSLSLQSNGGGSIQKNKSGSTFEEGTTVRLTAVPKDGWNFTGWSGSASGSSASISVTMNGKKSIQANFEKEPEPEPEPKTYSLSTSVVGFGKINASRTSAQEGESITVKAIPAEGWRFVEWRGDAVGYSSSSTITMDGNKQVTAVFEEE